MRLGKKAINIVVDRSLFKDYAVGLYGAEQYKDKDAILSKGRRLLFCVPWRKGTIIGTIYKRTSDRPSSCRIYEGDVLNLLQEWNAIYPAGALTPEEVSFFHAGLVLASTGLSRKQTSLQLDKESTIYDHEKTMNIKGLIAVKGVKYTTATEIARDVVNLVFLKQGRAPAPPSDEPPLPGGKTAPSLGQLNIEPNGQRNSLDPKTLESICNRYGARAKMVLDLVGEDRQLANRISDQHSVIAAEVVHSVREEMAQCLSDVVMRRTGLGSFGYPGKLAVQNCAKIMSRELGWDERRQDEEIDALEREYRVSRGLGS